MDACYDALGSGPAAGGKACRTVQQVVRGLARACRSAAHPDPCASFDGRTISEALVDAYAGTWGPRALALQRGLDDASPLQEELWVHTHNSFNAEAYSPTVSGLDANQIYSITDQLRMGVRAIEIDVHWAPSIEGLPGDGGKAPIVCHGEPVEVGPVVVHVGCTIEVHLRTRLAEVRAWLDRPENAGEILMIYLENNMDGDPTAHTRASEAISETLGDLVYRPASAGGACDPLPMDVTRAQLRAAGKRVILTGNCGPGAWTSWVFQRGPRWIESGSPIGADYPDYPACVSSQRQPDDYGHNWIRWFEDSTWLSAMVDGTALGGTSEIPADEARRMVRCGVNMIGFDQLEPFDRRLEALVWSWAPGEPSTTADDACAVESGGDGRFRAQGCGSAHRFACLTTGGWTVAGPAGPWSDGPTRCAGLGGTFAVPRSGYDNELLKAAAGGADAWLAYRADAGAWAPGP